MAQQTLLLCRAAVTCSSNNWVMLPSLVLTALMSSSNDLHVACCEMHCRQNLSGFASAALVSSMFPLETLTGVQQLGPFASVRMHSWCSCGNPISEGNPVNTDGLASIQGYTALTHSLRASTLLRVSRWLVAGSPQGFRISSAQKAHF